jgi:hypothetical protein
MKVFHCDHCGHLLFFENVQCVSCGRALAYVPERMDMTSLDRIDDATWSSPLIEAPLRLCSNYSRHDVCNWSLPADDPHSLCASCRLTRTIPNLEDAAKHRLWYKLEVAKRRWVYTVLQLGLPLSNQLDDPQRGLAFDFLEQEPGAPPVLTGHAAGVITVNLAEADDAERVRRRGALGEPYRTLLGHFRHESGHYYWDRLIAGSKLLAPFRDLFGDERADYGDALARHYEQYAAPADWQDRFISAYASMHPWEDWAETWAHYLHMTDTLEIAAACGLSIKPRRRDEPRLANVSDPTVATRQGVAFEPMMESWGTITYVMNNLNRGMGTDDAYPFVLCSRAIEKLRFVHESIASLRV